MRRLTLIGAVFALLTLACGGTAETTTTTAADATTTTGGATTTTADTTEEETTTTETTEAAADSATLVVADTEFGNIITDGEGMTLYIFTPDEQGDPTCNDACADNWPPLIGDVSAGDGVDAGLLGTASRDDGSEQVTYNGWPLYHFAQDSTAGDIKGQGVQDVWFVISDQGDPITS
jgi:predicted lipoprotein with Yx(FWY)xxD motif